MARGSVSAYRLRGSTRISVEVTQFLKSSPVGGRQANQPVENFFSISPLF